MSEMTLERIVASGLCTGCGACAYVVPDDSVRMRLDAAGFLRPMPTRPLTRDEQASVRQVCPGAALSHAPSPDLPHSPLWGPVADVAAGHATDGEIRHRASSGGVLSALLVHLLEQGEIDFALHVRADPDAPLCNIATVSRTRAEVLSAAGSRYAPASPVAALRDALAQPGRMAFVGKPCDVAAVRKLIKRDPALSERIPYLLSFMCAGTPSAFGTDALVRRMGMVPSEVAAFRYRGNGWPGMARAEAHDGRFVEMDYDRSWGQVLNRHLQFRCKICPDGTGEFADVSCADAWHGDEKGYPAFEEAEGRSLIIARTRQGAALCDSAREAGAIESKRIALEEVEAMQPYQVARKRGVLSRLIGLRLALRPIPAFRAMGLRSAAAQMPLMQHARNMAGAWVRAVGLRTQK